MCQRRADIDIAHRDAREINQGGMPVDVSRNRDLSSRWTRTSRMSTAFLDGINQPESIAAVPTGQWLLWTSCLDSMPASVPLSCMSEDSGFVPTTERVIMHVSAVEMVSWVYVDPVASLRGGQKSVL